MIAVADDPTPPYPRMWQCRSRFDSTLSGESGGVWATREKERGRFGGSDERLRRSGDDHIGSKLVLFVQTVLQRYRVIVC